MAKKCIICNEEANFKIKDSSEFYCKECAEENFADLSLLQKIEQEVKALKEAIDQINAELQETLDRKDQNF